MRYLSLRINILSHKSFPTGNTENPIRFSKYPTGIIFYIVKSFSYKNIIQTGISYWVLKILWDFFLKPIEFVFARGSSFIPVENSTYPIGEL